MRIVIIRGCLRQRFCGGSGGAGTHEMIQGTVAWEDETGGELPKIATVEGKECGWAELGKELMSYEGSRIRIELE